MLVIGSFADKVWTPPPPAAYIVLSRVGSLESLVMLCRFTDANLAYFKPTTSQLRELVRLHDLHIETCARLGVVDTSPLFPAESKLDPNNYRSVPRFSVTTSFD